MFRRQYPNGCAFDGHAEMLTIKKAINMGINLKGKDIHVIRFRRNGSIGMSKPCEFCQKMIESVGIRRVYYTDDNGIWQKYNVK